MAPAPAWFFAKLSADCRRRRLRWAVALATGAPFLADAVVLAVILGGGVDHAANGRPVVPTSLLAVFLASTPLYLAAIAGVQWLITHPRGEKGSLLGAALLAQALGVLITAPYWIDLLNRLVE